MHTASFQNSTVLPVISPFSQQNQLHTFYSFHSEIAIAFGSYFVFACIVYQAQYYCHRNWRKGRFVCVVGRKRNVSKAAWRDLPTGMASPGWISGYCFSVTLEGLVQSLFAS